MDAEDDLVSERKLFNGNRRMHGHRDICLFGQIRADELLSLVNTYEPFLLVELPKPLQIELSSDKKVYPAD